MKVFIIIWIVGLIVSMLAAVGILLRDKKRQRDEERARRFCAFWCHREYMRWQVDRLHAPDLSQRDLSWAEVEQVIEKVRTSYFVPRKEEKDFKVHSDMKVGVESMAIINGFRYKVKRFWLSNSSKVVVYSRCISDLGGPQELKLKRKENDED